MRQFIAIGNCVVDTILSVPYFVKEDDKVRASDLNKRRGGNTPNLIDVLGQFFETETQESARPALNLAVVLPKRSSPAVQEIFQSLGPGINMAHCIHREECSEPSSSYILKNLASDTRTIISYNALADMNLDEFKWIAESLPKEASLFHFEGRIPSVTLACIKHLRWSRRDAMVSVEIEKHPRDGLEDLIPHADVIFYSKTWAVGNGYKDPKSCLEAQAKVATNAFLLFCTWGAEGASALETAIGAYTQQPAWVSKTDSVVDTIGAGDTFTSGILYSLLAHESDWTVSRRLAFASELAGRKIMQEGFKGLASLMQDKK